MVDSNAPLAFVCGYTEDESGGIFSYRLNEADGTLRQVNRTPAEGAAFAAVHPDGTHLYTVKRVSGGVVTAYRVDPETGELAELNRQSSEGAGPSYVSVDATGQYVFVSNFAGGTVAMLPIKDGGKLGAATDVVTHESLDGEPHPHSIGPEPENRFVYAPDLGTDRIAIYRVDGDQERLAPAEPPYATVADGAGPRHFDVHPTDRVVYVINERDSTVTAFEYDPETGRLKEIQTVSTLPETVDAENYCADIHVHPSGTWLYGTNRGHDSIVVFEIDGKSGRLTPISHESTRGHWPRDFALGPTGRYLYVENQQSDSIVPFEIDSAGRLEPIDHRIDVPEPMCLQFLDPKPSRPNERTRSSACTSLQ